jgi:urate oxidase
MTKPTKLTEGWRKKLDELIDNDYWSYSEEERSMIVTTKKIKDFISELLEANRQQTIEECIKTIGTLRLLRLLNKQTK